MSPCERIKYLCTQCDKQFSKKGHLDEHQRAIHEGVKYPCSKCKYQAASKGNLARHHRGVHEGVKYPCKQCRKHFSEKRSLAKHQKESCPKPPTSYRIWFASGLEYVKI